MWTRAPPFTSDHAVVPSCLALDQEAEAGEEACCPRLHHNHQPGEQEPLEYHHYHAVTKHTLALDYSHPSSHPTSHIHHDPPEATGSSKRLPTQGFPSKRSCTKHQHSPMSSPESASVLARDRELLLPEVDTKLGSCSLRARERRQLDDMQTQTTRNASSDQEVPELVALSSPPKRRRVLLLNEFVKPKDSPHLSSAPGDHSGVTAEQLMADLDSGSKASTPDCQVPASVEEGADQLAAPQCSSTPPVKQVVEEEANHNVESNVTLEQSSRQLDAHPSDDDTQSTSQIRIWVPHSQPSRYCSKTMATRGSDEWLQLSLGSGVQSEETPPEDRPGESPTQTRNPSTSTDLPPGGDIRDFFRFGSESEAHQSSSPVTPRHQQQYSGTPEFSVPRPLTFLEPEVRSSRDSPWMDPNVAIPRGEGQFLSPSPVVQQRPAFSNLATLPYRPARALQLVRSEQTDTTSVYASPWMGTQQHPYQEAPRTPPEFLSMATPGAFRDWRSAGASAASPGSFLSMQPPLAQGVDPEQAWRNLLQRVGSNLSVPSGFGAAGASSSSGRGEPMMLPPGEREEYLDALTRAVERFQGADQGGKDEPLTELQRLQRNALFPPGQRPHRGPSFGPSTEISMARYFNTSSSSGSKPRAPAPAPSSDRQRRILRPHAPRPGLWFTLQASTSQPEASPLQQIPSAYIRVVDDNMTVAAVRRYLVSKLGLASEDEVELTCRGQPLQPSLPLSQVRDGIWQSPSTNTPTPSTSQLLSEGKAWKAPDGSITLVDDVVMVLTYGRGPQAPPPTST